MSAEEEIVEQVIDQSGTVLEKTYDDLIHPTAKSVGNTLSLIPRTVGVWLSKWEKWIINGEESIRLTAQAVQEKAAKIPEEKLTEPEPYVAIPVVQQLSYCYDSEELREMYANLLVSSMNVDKKYSVHPAFVDIIKQLTPDEAKLLKYISQTKENSIPIVDVVLHISGIKNGIVTIVQSYSNVYKDVLEAVENYQVYVENLIRLNLCNIPGTYFLNTELYDEIMSDPQLPDKEIIDSLSRPISTEDNNATIRKEIKKRSLDMTAFGKSFTACCIE